MQMNRSAIQSYLKFAYYVRHNLPEILNVPVIVSVMSRIGQINLHTLRTAVRWGYGPVLRVVPLVGACGEFTPNIHSNEIRISNILVRNFENGRGGHRIARGRNVHVVGVTILHELIHWGDDQNGIDRPGEEGEEFERAVYGAVVPCY
jgi:hypothetical protein